jgi:hypothetical protein
VSLDLVVLDLPALPLSREDENAGELVAELVEAYLVPLSGIPDEPLPSLQQYAAALVARYREPTESSDDSPWKTGPLVADAAGPVFHLSLIADEQAAEVWDFAVATARAHGLACFDPQSDEFVA